ncbi:MAG TPA: diaminopimelate decarboxylase [bacterium]|nr:diaminopimelate decarboxylase [bacterium]
MTANLAARHGYGMTSGGHLAVGGCDAVALAHEFGTPLHVIDEARFRNNCRAYRSALDAVYGANAQPLYASKALCVVATCQLAAQEGFGVDVASGGEIHTALRAGLAPSALYFHGNNKTPAELEDAVRLGIGRIIVDNEYELDVLDAITQRLGADAQIQLRLTPGIEPHTHKAIRTGGVDSKFGFGMVDGSAHQAVARASRMSRVRLRGIHAHIGSQAFDLEPFARAAAALVEFAARVRDDLDVTIEEINCGGGLGIRYLAADEPPTISDFVAAVAGTVKAAAAEHHLSPPRLFIEPGRSIVGDAGVTLYTVGAIKAIPGIRTYVAVDGGMYENPRPALYGARYEAVRADRPADPPSQTVALAGQCCESGDVLIWDAAIPPVAAGDTLAVFATGAYTYSMGSNYNRFPRPAVVLAGGGRARVVVARETYEDLVRKDVALDAGA